MARVLEKARERTPLASGATAASATLIVNGDFEAGATGFATDEDAGDDVSYSLSDDAGLILAFAVLTCA